MLLLDYWPLRRPLTTARRLVLEKWPFFLLTIASCIVTFLAQKQGEAVISLARVPLAFRLGNAPVAVVDYLFKLFWPVDLCAYYPMPGTLARWQVFLSAGLVVMLTVAAWRWRRPQPCFLIGWLWFLGTLVPVIGLLQVGGQAMADRYMYIPSIGLFLALVFLARDLAGRVQLPQIISTSLMALTAAACILVTEHQLQYWRDSEALFRRALAVDPRNDVAMIDLGIVLHAQGRTAEAMEFYQAAERIDPTRFQLHNDLGNVLSDLGRHTEALAEYRQGIALRPRYAVLHQSAGSELAALNHLDEALTEFAVAEQCDPARSGPHLAAAEVLFKQGRDPAGVAEFRAAVRLAPDDYQTLATVARYLAISENPATRDGQSALPLALKANVLSSQSQPVVFDVLGMALAENGDFTNAIACAQNALALAATARMPATNQFRLHLDRYRQNLPWRESFRATNAPATD
jgi:tetratricopeptide (TPR) repeat protein